MMAFPSKASRFSVNGHPPERTARLVLSGARLRGDELACRRAARTARALSGVLSASAHVRYGVVDIRYDDARLEAREILERFYGEGFIQRPGDARAPSPTRPTIKAVGLAAFAIVV